MSADNEICRMDAATVAAKVREKRLSAAEVTEAVLRRMEKLEPHIHAFCTPTPTGSRRRGRRHIGAGKDPRLWPACRSTG